MVNYNFPRSAHTSEKDKKLDPLAEKYGQGETHAKYEHVERLVKLHLDGDKISLADESPLQFELLDNNVTRNWEGLAIWPKHGFLVVTDKFPGSILGFIAF